MKTVKPILLVLAGLALNACSHDSIKPADTQAINQSSTVDLKTLCKDAKHSPTIACSDTVTASFDKQGKLWVVWVNDGHIYLQSSTDQGEHFSQPVQVNAEAESIAAHGEYRPKIKLDNKGAIYLSWTQNLEKRHTGNIRFSRSLDGGNRFSKPITVNDNLDIIGHRFDALEIGKNGEIFIAWLDSREKEAAKAKKQEFLGTAVYYTWSDNGGQSFYPNKALAPHSCECCRLGIAIDNDNLPVVLWRHVFEGQIRDQALVKFKDWNTPGPVQRASQDNWKIEACPHHGPALSIADDGTYHSVWFSGATDHQGLFYGYSNDQGKSFSTAYPFGNQGAKHPSVMAIGEHVAIIWSEFDGKNNLLKLIQSSDSGKTWSTAKTVTSTSESADDGFLISDGDNLYLSWQTGQGYQFKALADL